MRRFLGAALAIALFAAGANAQSSDADPRLWLENSGSPQVTAWVAAQNTRTKAAIIDTPLYRTLYEESYAALMQFGSLPSADERGGYVYDLERSRAHPRGVWRRASFDTLVAGSPQWAPLLDIDALAARDGRAWAFQGSACLPPAYVRCMLSLAQDGGDALVQREFDLTTRSFVAGGFEAPEAKGESAFLDENTLLLAAGLSANELTEAQYAGAVRLWRRGEPLANAPIIVRAGAGDLRLGLERIGGRMFVRQDHTFGERTWIAIDDGQAHALVLPRDVSLFAIERGLLVFGVDTDWNSPRGQRLRAGAIYSAPLAAIERGRFRATEVFAPGPRQTITGVEYAGGVLIVSVLDDLSGRLLAFQLRGGRWRQRAIELPANLNVSLGSVSDASRYGVFVSEGFLQPRTLQVLDLTDLRVRTVATTPSSFDASNMIVERRAARSRDGTMVPYFVVRRRDAPLDGSNPTHMFAYGGFGFTLTPTYSGAMGRVWLARGGVYVQANLRGGGEFGESWHQAATRERRQNAYDDAIAVAQDLIAAGYTRPDKLGFLGGSNGGLLAGVMYNQRPDLFGAIVSGGPLLDMVRYDQLLAGASWRDEYGDPGDPVQGAFLRRISPYHNVDAGVRHPPIMLITSSSDDRVHPGHARKFAALLDELDQPHWFYEGTEGGHGGTAFFENLAQQSALTYAFFWQALAPEQGQAEAR